MALEALSGRVGPGRSAGEFVDLSVCPCASGDHAIPQPAVSKQEGGNPKSTSGVGVAGGRWRGRWKSRFGAPGSKPQAESALMARDNTIKRVVL